MVNYVRQNLSGLILAATILLSPALLIASESATNAPAATATNLCPQFTLQDQFEQTHAFTFPQTKPVVLTVADKKGSEGIKDWAHPLAETFGDKIIITGLADMSTVPSPLRGLVRSKFKKVITYPVMLDWHGQASQSFNYSKGSANVYLIATNGTILHHLTGKANEEQLKQLTAWIERELALGSQANARSN